MEYSTEIFQIIVYIKFLYLLFSISFPAYLIFPCKMQLPLQC